MSSVRKCYDNTCVHNVSGAYCGNDEISIGHYGNCITRLEKGKEENEDNE